MQDHNFELLKNEFGILALVGEIAERNVYQNPNLCMSELRKFAEMMTRFNLAKENIIEVTELNQIDRLKLLLNNDILPKEIYDFYMTIYINGCKAYQDYAFAKVEDAKILLHMSFKITAWFIYIYGEQSIEIPKYQEPVPHNPISDRELIQLLDDYEQKMYEVDNELDKIRYAQRLMSNQEKQKRRERSKLLAASFKVSGEERLLIMEHELIL